MTEDLHHLAAAYALDALSDEERSDFEAHYPLCDVCAAEVADFRETAAALAAGVATPAPPDLKAQIMADIAITRQVSPLVSDRVVDLAEQRRRNVASRPRFLAAAAAAVLVVVGAIAGFGLRSSEPNEVEAVLMAPDARTLDLAGDQPGSVTVVWSPGEDEAVLLGSNLEPAGEGRDYALWLIDEEGANPAGLFEPNADGSIEIVIDLQGRSPAAWGITNEPDGGSPQPTTDILFVAEAA